MESQAKSLIDAKREAKEQSGARAITHNLWSKLYKLSGDRSTYGRRWFWELVQNACDECDDGHAVNISLDIDDQTVTFTHDGRPFTSTQVQCLIDGNSDKVHEHPSPDSREQMGRFGSGFIASHVLSAKIKVEGTLSEKGSAGRFSFLLDRSQHKDKGKLFAAHQLAQAEYEREIPSENTEANTTHTRFTHFLNTPLENMDSCQVLRDGLEGLTAIAPVAITLIKNISSIEVRDRRTANLQPKIERFERASNSNHVVHSINGETLTAEPEVWTAEAEGCTVAVLIKDKAVVPFPEHFPKLFTPQPLIGTDDFPFPTPICSVSFKPDEERDGLQLAAVPENQRVLENSLTALASLLGRLATAHISGCFELVHFPKSTTLKGISAKWYDDHIEPRLRKILAEACAIEIIDGNWKPLGDCRIPRIGGPHQNELLPEFMAVAKHLYSEKLPALRESEFWQAHWDTERFPGIALTPSDLLKETVAWKRLTQVPSIEWLNALLSFILRFKPTLLTEYSLIPDQSGMLRKAAPGLNFDDGVDTTLIEIQSLLTKEDYRTELIDQRIIRRVEGLRKETDITNGVPPVCLGLLSTAALLTSKELAKKIDDWLSRMKRDERKGLEYERAMGILQEWVARIEGDEALLSDYFKWFHKERYLLQYELYSPTERAHANEIRASGSQEAILALVRTRIGNETIREIAFNAEAVQGYLSWRKRVIQEHPDLERGDLGEVVVVARLRETYPEPTYSVDWDSRKTAEKPIPEGRWDMKVRKGDEILCYVDAKSTNQGKGSSDGIPFFVKEAQWDFLETPEAKGKYVFARVFEVESGEPHVIWLAAETIREPAERIF